MTLTLDITPETESAKLVKAAVALYDARLLSQEQAAEMAGLSRAAFIKTLGRDGGEEQFPEIVQGSSEWNARLHSAFHAQTPLTDEQTRRESLYGDDLR